MKQKNKFKDLKKMSTSTKEDMYGGAFSLTFAAIGVGISFLTKAFADVTASVKVIQSDEGKFKTKDAETSWSQHKPVEAKTVKTYNYSY